MNLWVVGWSAERPVDAARPRAALERLLERLPFFPGERVQTWAAGPAVAAWVAHGPERVGGRRYAEPAVERFVLWSGHPVGEGDGRWARVLWERGSALEVSADAMGAYPVYLAEGADGMEWASNNAELLRDLIGSRDVDPAVVASLVGGGWSLSGDPVWQGVRRLPRGQVRRFGGASGGPRRLPVTEIVAMLGRGLDVDAAARDLVDVTRELASWPGRPNVVPVTAGRDSRLVLAAALRAGVEFTTNTGGRPGEADVDVGRELARIAGVAHELIPDDPHGALHSHWRRAAELLGLTAAGTASVADAVGFPHGPREGPLPLWHSGQGGEIARGYYAARVRGGTPASLADSLYGAFVMRRPHRSELLSADGEQIVRGQIAAFVGEVTDAGASPADVPDLFYLLRRMGTWAGPTHGAVEYVRDTTSPLWSERMLPHLLALPARERAAEELHRRLLERLAPELAAAPGWPARQSELARRGAHARSLARKVAAELRRRARARRPAPAAATGDSPPADPFAPVLAEIRDAVLSQDSHPAWNVVDRARAESLLSRDAASLDEVSQYYVWRLATIFGATLP
jgi:asparagine synthetase B (glutamine-hydrolysing)